ncbi:cupin domain-containing protein [Sulfitobacter mediterraneus]|uniref:cupin domain-containing protein n=1 Tax=Sulfitobacter mediterraneus TaxID=83219 RepID=UPI001934A7F1|nr:cupin domain-containing protein [Sulfitobacter mediterraneus]MBM1634902.1 cupin domain-containing protein [Sulfitobacter mediterraneus]MBM1642809.1 cupin domain-containing protein [Sulfitobacter mediterraneus]MBM1646857.1 cupin domain-containing protein [Sulfitobacter mediterraneus]MBM1650815.1 cupin domain-containing protein [Sulfitobacter mediterraneus]MBM1654925.1 cupin domain-containing protein [Sulfitobacter mediterraneus]
MAKVGKRVATLRQRRMLTVRELAARSGIAHSTISLIERDKVSPSVDTLAAIVDALGATLTAFFGIEGVQEGIPPFYSEADLVEIGSTEQISYRMVGMNFAERQMLLMMETYQPGAVSTEALSHKAQEGGFVLQGAVRVSVGDEVRVLKAGDGYYFDSRIPHSFENLSDGESKIVSAVTPPNY